MSIKNDKVIKFGSINNKNSQNPCCVRQNASGGINAFDITNLDLYYGIKTSYRKNVSNIHIELKTNGYPKSADFLLCPYLQESKRPSNIISAAEYLRLKRNKAQNISTCLAYLPGKKKHNRKISKLAAASIAVALSVFFSPVTAQETAPPVPVPTLDKLHQEGVINPATAEKDQDGNPIEGTGVVYPESAYVLTKVDTAGENTITKYEWSDSENKLVPVYYRVDLKQTAYGDGEGEKYFRWDNSSGENKLVETDAANSQITAKYDSSISHQRLENSTTTSISEGGSFVGQSESQLGGAVNNSGTIESINTDFVNNYVDVSNSHNYGGAIHNSGTIGDITSEFIGNYASGQSGYGYGGAIHNYNNATIGNITGDFIGNYAQGTGHDASGGAIASNGKINGIAGDFVGNYVNGNYVQGGAIYNDGSNASIGSIQGNFINNYADAYASAYGGAIYNYDAQIEDISGDFIGNYSSSDTYYARGGAIYNRGQSIGSITGDFIKNYTVSAGNNAYGGAIFNYAADIGSITGDFIENYASGVTEAYGGAIYNNQSIGDIDSDFVGNYVFSENVSALGGAIYNNGTSAEIKDITGNFTGNYASSNSFANGGAIFNTGGTITNISSNFTGNYTSSVNASANGGAIDNSGKIENITGNFTGNYVTTTSSADYFAQGGAIYNSAEIGDITGNFVENYAQTSSSSAMGGAIYSNGSNSKTGDIKGSFVNNYASGRDASGGAIYNNGAKFGSITGDFSGNYAKGNYVQGGAIYNNGSNAEIKDINGNFTNNYIDASNSAYGGAIYNYDAKLGNITGNFSGNYSDSEAYYARGGAIYNRGQSIDSITGDFIQNYTTSAGNNAYGGAIFNYEADIGDITGNFVGNYASGVTQANGGAIYNYNHSIGDIKGNFIGNYTGSTNSYAYGGAIYNSGATIGRIDDTGSVSGGIYGSFVNNYTKSEANTELALGGAVYTNADLNFIADNQTNTFSGNYTEDKTQGKVNNAIFVATSQSSSPTITLQAQNNGSIVFDDQIDGGSVSQTTINRTHSYNLNITGDKSSKVVLNNDIINANVSLQNTNLYLGRDNILNQSKDLTLNSGNLYLNNNQTGAMEVQTLNLNGTTNISLDVDLANGSMDRITADTYNIADGAQINIENLNILSSSNNDVVKILFADENLAKYQNGADGSPIVYSGQNIIYSPIYKYSVDYDVDENDKLGYFFFAKGAGSSTSDYNAFNPAVVASSVATLAGAYATQLQTFNYAFQHSDMFMNIPHMQRQAIVDSNKYALSPTSDAADVGTFSPLLTKPVDTGFWVRPYASFESIPIQNGPKVSNINYGTLIGYDSPITSLSNGWERVITGYIGYNGASQRYQGVDSYQNGGIVGGTTTFYKGNFFNATTLSVGASAGNSNTMFGTENYTMLLAGLGNKTGYNFEFWDGRMIFQPSFLISYTFVNTFDYTNAAGLRIDSDPFNAIQLAPGIKLIGNTKNGWQPYIGVNMVWNLLQDANVNAGNVRLPEMSIKPYIQYGVGLQKFFADNFVAFGQAMIHNGGRNGVSLSAGLRWKVGRKEK